MGIYAVTDYTNTYAAGRTNVNNGISGSAQDYLCMAAGAEII